MKMKLNSVAAAVALALTAGGAANASAISTQPSSGASSLVLTVYDATAGRSYFAEIGGAGTLAAVNNGTFNMTGLDGLFDASTTSNIYWGITAGDTTLAAGAGSVYGQRALSTSASAVGPTVDSADGYFPGVASNNMVNFDQQACGAVAAGSPCIATSASDPTYAGGFNWGSDWGFTGIGIGAFVSDTTTMNMWMLQPANTGDEFLDSFQNPIKTNTGYTAALNLAAGTVTISAVPLPAAAWLLLSGLGAMGVVGRRRRLAA